MAAAGIRVCVIAETLRFSEPCVSKIVERYKETGSIRPEGTEGIKPKLVTPEIQRKVPQKLSCIGFTHEETHLRIVV